MDCTRLLNKCPKCETYGLMVGLRLQSDGKLYVDSYCVPCGKPYASYHDLLSMLYRDVSPVQDAA